jgi:hypothetical protein
MLWRLNSRAGMEEDSLEKKNRSTNWVREKLKLKRSRKTEENTQNNI